MREFLKPTKSKVLLAVLFLFIELVIVFGYPLYLLYTGESMTPLCLPNLGGTPPAAYQNPHSLSEAWQLANTPDPCDNPWPPGIYSPLVKTIQYTQGVVVVAVLLVLPYLISCILLAYTSNLKKKKNGYPAPSRK